MKPRTSRLILKIGIVIELIIYFLIGIDPDLLRSPIYCLVLSIWLYVLCIFVFYNFLKRNFSFFESSDKNDK